MPTEHRLHARCGCSSSVSAEHAVSAGRPFAFPTSARHFERDRPFAVDHLDLDVTLEVAEKSIRAEASLDVRRIDPSAEELPLDAVGFDVHDVRVDGKGAPWRYDGRTLQVHLGPSRDTARVTVRYRATPRRGLYFIEPDAHYPDKPRQVWSQCQEEDARHIFPCHDSPHAKMTTRIAAHVPGGWFALSNGALLSSDAPAGGDATYVWQMEEPHASYLVTLVAGEFAEMSAIAKAGGREIPLSYFVPKGREADGRRAFAHTPKMVEHFSEVTGVPYPWVKYAQIVVSDFIFGGMENTTATTLYEHVLLDERAAIDISSDDLVAHELAHHWFGDYVTCRAWYEGWLNEGFATYFEHVWREHRLGADEYDFGLKGDFDAYAAEARGRYRRAIVCQDYDAPLDLFDRHLYEKGGLVLHALRAEVGTEVFWRGVRAYLEAHAKGVVETRDLQRALEEVSGRGLGRFFEQWVYKPGHPEVEIEVGWDRGILSVSTKQTQSTADGVPASFELPLDLDLGASRGGVERRALRITEKQQSFALPAPERPSFVVVDPAMRILGEVRVKAPLDMLRAQLAKAPTARGRWLAAQVLAKSDDPPSIAALARSLSSDEEFWGTRAECAASLGRIRTRECFDALKGARQVTHPKVRRAVVDALGSFRTIEAMEAIKPHALRDASYLVEGDAARALGRTRQAAAFDVLVDLLDRPSWYDVVRAGAIDGLATLRDERAVPLLGTSIRYGHPTRVRRASAIALPKIAGDRKTRETLENLLEDPDPIFRIDVVRALGDLADGKARPALRERLDTDNDPRVRRHIREALRDLNEPKRAAEPLREELDKLQDEHRDLKSRLAKLEAQVVSSAPRPPRGRGERAKTDEPKREPKPRGRKKRKKG
ncbi:MAG TPA: M1 family aminopeptidase [Polyangiaceae bacterium]|jgi:aminopeptidase N